MYWEEKMINGVMHWRRSPDDEFTPYTLEDLSKKWESHKETIRYVNERAYLEGKNFEQNRIANLLGIGTVHEDV
jgi:hypothetical protein